MSKSPGEPLRVFVVSELVRCFEHAAALYSMGRGGQLDREVASQWETHPGRYDLAARVANHVLTELGFDVGEPADPRFDKTKRAAAKLAGKPPKGMSKAERAAWEAEQAADSAAVAT